MIKYIKELRNRFSLLLLCWVNVFLVSYFYKEVLLFEVLKITANDSDILFNHFIFTKVTELFVTYIELASFTSNQILFIYSIYHFLYFIAPGLYLKEYNLLKRIFQLISCFWCLSLVFLNTYFVPFVWTFFLNFQNRLMHQWVNIQFEAKVSDYLDFIIKLYYNCNLQFQLIVCLLSSFVFFNTSRFSMKRFKKAFYFLFLITATLFTPPDMFSQILVFFVLILFFEFMMVLKLFFYKL